MSGSPIVVGGGTMDLGAMLAQAMGGGDGPRGGGETRTAPDILIPRLQENYRRYVEAYGINEDDQKRCPFIPGQLVTPIAGTAMKGAGAPHIVLETRWVEPRDHEPEESGNATSNTYGSRRNIRVMGESRNVLVCHWVEPHEFEAYVEQPTADDE